MEEDVKQPEPSTVSDPPTGEAPDTPVTSPDEYAE